MDIKHVELQWKPDVMNPYIPKNPVKRTIFFNPVTVKCMEKNPDITNTFCQSLGSSFYRGSTVI